MESSRKESLIYETEQGGAPFSSWLNGLKDREAKARIFKRLDRVALGNFGDYRSVGDGVFELRIDHVPRLSSVLRSNRNEDCSAIVRWRQKHSRPGYFKGQAILG